MYTGKAISDAKVWNTPGGQQISQVKNGTLIKADNTTTYSGVKYLHLTSPVLGWSKAMWFSYSESTIPPLPGPIVVHQISVYDDGKISVDGGNPY